MIGIETRILRFKYQFSNLLTKCKLCNPGKQLCILCFCLCTCCDPQMEKRLANPLSIPSGNKYISHKNVAIVTVKGQFKNMKILLSNFKVLIG